MSMATYMCEPYESSVVNIDCSTTSVFAWNDFESSRSSIPCLGSPVSQPLPVSHSTPRRKGAFERTPVFSEKRSSQLSSTSQMSSTSQLLSSVCCESRFLTSLSLLEVEGCHKNFESRSNIEQQQFILYAISLTASENDQMLILSGKQLCKVAFAKVLGISEKGLRKISKVYLQDATLSQQSCQVKKSKSTKHSSALAWMECYFDRIGDKMPHLQQIYLPHFLSRKTVYELMVQDLLDEGLSRQEIISKSIFMQFGEKNSEIALFQRFVSIACCAVGMQLIQLP